MTLIWLLLRLTEASCCLFDRIQEPRPGILVEKQLGWDHKLGQVDSLGILKMGHTLLAMLMESQIWHQLAGCVCAGEGLEKGQ